MKALAILVITVAAFATAEKKLFGGKLNDEGKYLRHAGITLISFLKNRVDPKWVAVQSYIAESELSKFYAPLPASSYHMTVFPLLTEFETRMSPGAFRYSLWQSKEKFTAIHDSLVKSPVAPRPRVTAARAESLIVLVLDVDESSDGERLDEIRKLVSDKTGLRSTAYSYHVTLAYRYRDPSESQQPAIDKALQNLEKLISEAVGQSGRLKLEPARLMLFDSMTEFVPTNPHKWQPPAAEGTLRRKDEL